MKPPKQAYTIICVRTSKNLQTPLQGALCREKGMRPVRVPACPGPSSTLSPISCVVLVCWYVSTRVCGGGRLFHPFSPNCGLSAISPILRLVRNSLWLVAVDPQVRPTSSAFLSELPLRPPVPVCDLTSSFRFVRAPPTGTACLYPMVRGTCATGLSGPLPPALHSLSAPRGLRGLVSASFSPLYFQGSFSAPLPSVCRRRQGLVGGSIS